ncbi:MAG: cbb3-type cytochrome c oxidase subunit 3 [Deltaproteobacteria bacterium]|nr:cbb3-type cytochrome c oxidase subunit 3 [Deltaproteobacteria bacterium]
MGSGLFIAIADAILFVAFVVFCVWAFSPAQKRRWQESAELPFLDDDGGPSAPAAQGGARHE